MRKGRSRCKFHCHRIARPGLGSVNNIIIQLWPAGGEGWTDNVAIQGGREGKFNWPEFQLVGSSCLSAIGLSSVYNFPVMWGSKGPTILELLETESWEHQGMWIADRSQQSWSEDEEDSGTLVVGCSSSNLLLSNRLSRSSGSIY